MLTDPFRTLLGESPAMASVRAFGRRAAGVDAPVLLTGESGTGKGLLARAIHEASRRAPHPFVPVNCAGVPASLFESEFFGHVRGAFTGAQRAHRGLIEQATGGTLFLDEIGELPSALQAKLLAAVEDRTVRRLGAERSLPTNVRLVAASNADLDAAVRRGDFRSDLLFRLVVLSCELPPLRERGDDIELLARQFVERHGRRHQRAVRSITSAALRRLRAHRWPGNVRELDHVIEAAVVACDGVALRVRDLPVRLFRHHHPRAFGPLPETAGRRRRYSFTGTPAEERHRIERALEQSGGNRTRAARILGMSRTTLRSRMRALDIEEDTGRDGQ